ncbi:MAG TPA: 1-(5-phosphoribosyl)-5-[(5-phosphoribosylamino)methylideneamino] imidazole-4-carboxamide isomerase [Candidatus Sulfotelmatobacter sp.]|nr:1-(5-phosphoribosyl)-5-[(5-phosphoribosylamino)methylideneamino] imidazole-4-carboxamide isomerase [Candidatus Sulfotelmatobacter sp.]
MLIPSIDLMDGKIVQLVQGSRKALEFDNFQEWIDRFSKYPLVQLVDLDAAIGRGDNHDLVREIVQQLLCQVGGGIRSVERAEELLNFGVHRVILGSSLIRDGKINYQFAEQVSEEVGCDRLVFAVDSFRGQVAIKGWKETTTFTPDYMMAELEPYCGTFLYTHIDTEGLLKGIPIEIVRKLRSCTSRKLIAAGGIRSQEEIDALHAIGVDAVVGMAIYERLLPV